MNSSPDSLEKLIALGDLYAGKGDEVESHHYYQEAIEKYPQKAEGYLRLGDLRSQLLSIMMQRTFI